MDRVLCVLFCIVVIIFAVCLLANCGSPSAEAVVEPTTEEVVEPTETIVATEPLETEPPIVLYDVPLDEELQLHIIEEAEKHGIDPAIIFAMAYRESAFNANCIGDGGNSFGLLQVQPRWHYGRMLELGCTDLFDPFQNVTVAIDYLVENLDRYCDIAKALVAYNQGNYKGTVTQYAKTILAYAEKLNNERSQ